MRRHCAYKSRLSNSGNAFDKMASTLQLGVFALLVTISLASPVSNHSRAADASTRCKFQGTFCFDCKDLVYCADLGNKFIEYKIQECDVDTAPCSSSLKKCSDKPSVCTNPDSTKKYFECVQEGIFPDPYDCNVYHQCPESDADGYPATRSFTCEEDAAFNPKTGLCDLPADDSLCGEESYPVPKCEAGSIPPVTVGALALNPQYYWICQSGVIHIIKCQDGTIFNGKGCVREDEEVTEQPSQETSEEPEDPPSGVFQCAGNGKEPDPESCTRFYDCSNPKQPIRFACPWPQYFHQRKARCVLGFCPY